MFVTKKINMERDIEMRQTPQEAAKEYCKAWGMEDGHGYGVKDTYMIGFVQGAKWQWEQSPWISVEEKLPVDNEGVFFVVEWVDHGKGYFVGLYRNGYWESDHRIFPPSSQMGKVTHWMPIPLL